MDQLPKMTPEAARAAPGAGRLIAVLGLVGFSSTFAMRLVDPLVPTLSGVFSLPLTTITTLVTAYGLSYACGQPLMGAAGDAFGKVRVILAAGGALALFLAVSAFAFGFEMLFVLRCLSGFAGGGLIPVAMAAIADRVPVAERSVALARFIMFVTMGQMLGATGAGILADLAGWRAPFVAASLVALSATLLVAIRLKPRPSHERPPASIGRALANYREVFRNPLAAPLLAGAVLEGALLFGPTPFVAALLGERSGVGAAEAGLVLASTGFGAMGYGSLAAILTRRVPPARLPLLGGFVNALALALFALPAPWWTSPPLFLLIGFGFMMMHNPMQVRATELSPVARSSGVAVFAASLFVGQALGPLLMGLLPHSSAAPYGLLVFSAGLALLGLYISRLVSRSGAG